MRERIVLYGLLAAIVAASWVYAGLIPPPGDPPYAGLDTADEPPTRPRPPEGPEPAPDGFDLDEPADNHELTGGTLADWVAIDPIADAENWSGVYVGDIATGELRFVKRGDLFQASWSPDSIEVLYTDYAGGDTPVTALNVDTTERRRWQRPVSSAAWPQLSSDFTPAVGDGSHMRIGGNSLSGFYGWQAGALFRWVDQTTLVGWAPDTSDHGKTGHVVFFDGWGDVRPVQPTPGHPWGLVAAEGLVAVTAAAEPYGETGVLYTIQGDDVREHATPVLGDGARPVGVLHDRSVVVWDGDVVSTVEHLGKRAVLVDNVDAMEGHWHQVHAVGDRIAFPAGKSLVVVDGEGTEIQRFTVEPGVETLSWGMPPRGGSMEQQVERVHYAMVLISPDGKRVLFQVM